MEEIRSSLDKIFDQFAAVDNTIYPNAIPKRLSYTNLNDSYAEKAPKKRKYSDEKSNSVKDNESFLNNTSFDKNTSLNGTSSIPASPWEYRRLRADIIENNALIAQLRREVDNRSTLHTQMETMYTDKLNGLQRQLESTTQRASDLDKHLKHIRRRQSAEKEELVKVKNQLSQQRISYEEHINSLQNANQELEHELRRTKHDMGTEIEDLAEQLKKTENFYNLTKEELDSLQDNHDAVQEKLRKFKELEVELDTERQQHEKAKRKIASLESEVAEFGQWKDMSKSFHSRLVKYPELEKEIERLKRDNKNLFDNIGHKLLLEEEVFDLKSRLEKAEKSNIDMITLRTQFQAVEKELNQYKSVAKDHCGPDTPITSGYLRIRIEEILQRDVILANEKNSVKNEKDSISNQIQELQRELEIYTKANNELQTSLKYHKSSLHRVQKKLMLVAKERDCYRQLTENYEKDLTISNVQSELTPDTQLKLRLDMLEKTVVGYKEVCASLEKELQSAKALPDLGIDSAVNGEQYAQLRAELESLRLENERLRRRKDELELTLEQMNLKGAFNLDKYKIVHMAMNPSSEAHEEHTNELEKLKAEIERLKRKNRKLEEDQEELTVRLNATINTTVDMKEVATLRSQIKSLENKNQHLKEVYKAAGLELREACYLMFGYRIDRIDNQHYKISSMYAESEEDCLHFQIDSGCINMLETEYSKSLDYISKTYLGKYQSFPAFLSMLQLDLFNRTTMV